MTINDPENHMFGFPLVPSNPGRKLAAAVERATKQSEQRKAKAEAVRAVFDQLTDEEMESVLRRQLKAQGRSPGF